MTDRSLDLELIMAIAKGAIPPEEAAAAERALDEAGRVELDLQRKAIKALAAASTPSLTNAERMAMRASVRTALNMDPGSAETKALTQPSPWYFRFLPIAAGLAIVLVVVAVGITSIIGGTGFVTGAADGDESFEEAGSQLAENGSEGESLSRPAAIDDTALADSIESEAGGADAAAEPPAAGAEETFAATTEAAAQDQAAARVSPDLDLGPVDSADVEQIRAIVEDALRDPDFILKRDAEFEFYAATLVGRICSLEISDGLDPGAEVLLAASATIDGQEGEVYVVKQGSTTTAYLYWLEDCTLVVELELDLGP